ncbi:unnamed protein product [Gongylonema pulchrum]|uniref:Uncharacterized protein n=1 Tax=Gongylonema pulchrum TaxID=637853 RepID=A0A183EGD2_9BILA|nr:unnamed protein product [Gongylonema pulchrum]
MSRNEFRGREPLVGPELPSIDDVLNSMLPIYRQALQDFCDSQAAMDEEEEAANEMREEEAANDEEAANEVREEEAANGDEEGEVEVRELQL